jgi:hypothetical protein
LGNAIADREELEVTLVRGDVTDGYSRRARVAGYSRTLSSSFFLPQSLAAGTKANERMGLLERGGDLPGPKER